MKATSPGRRSAAEALPRRRHAAGPRPARRRLERAGRHRRAPRRDDAHRHDRRRGVPRTTAGSRSPSRPTGSDLTIAPGRNYVDGMLCEIDASGSGHGPPAPRQTRAVGRAARLAAATRRLDRDRGRRGVGPALARGSSPSTAKRGPGSRPRLSRRRSRLRDAGDAALPDLPVPEQPTYPGRRAAGARARRRHVPRLCRRLAAPRHRARRPRDPRDRPRRPRHHDSRTRPSRSGSARDRATRPRMRPAPAVPDWTAHDEAPAPRCVPAPSRAEETDELCEIPADARYQRLENQLYRVEVHDPGELGSATFKWSRENASIAALWTDQDGDRLTVSSTGRDADLGFASGQLVELIDDTLELGGRPGTLRAVGAAARGPADDRHP